MGAVSSGGVERRGGGSSNEGGGVKRLGVGLGGLDVRGFKMSDVRRL